MKPDRDKYRKNLTKYTRRALQSIPELNNPRILDIGCGSGIPSLELVKLTNGFITGIDTDEQALEKLREKAVREGFGEKIETKLVSMDTMTFEDESFDMIWAEGSIAFIGFSQGLKDWKRLIKDGGYLVVHDELGDIEEKILQIRETGYRLIDHFILHETVWWEEYYGPLKKELGEHYEDGALTLEGEALEIFKEIEMYYREPERNRSVYFIMQKL
jgi:ubiquinone/menaquinone biosynthesis C-methylase UbiE